MTESTGDRAYEVLDDLEQHDADAVMAVIDELIGDDGALAEHAFSGKQEAFVKGIHVGRLLE